MTAFKRAIALSLAVGALTVYAGPASAGPPTPNADLQGSISADKEIAMVGDSITYTVQVHNAGPDAVRQVWVDLGQPANATFDSATSTGGSCKAADTIRCELGTMRAQATATVTLTVTAAATGWTSGNFYIASDQYANEPTWDNNYGYVTVFIDDGLNDVIEVGCSTTLGATQTISYWSGTPFTCASSGYISYSTPATLELIPGETFTGTVTVTLYRSQSDWTEPSFHHSFSRTFVAGVATNNTGNAATVELPAAGNYVLSVRSSAVRTDLDRPVCIPFRPTCVGQEDYYATYRSTSHGSFGARLQPST